MKPTEIWIVDKNGLCYFNYSNEEKVDSSLFGGFIAALNMFSDKGTKNKISSITTGDSLISFKQFDDSPLILIGRSQTLESKKLNKKLQKIYATFKKKYDLSILKDFDGDISVFNSFTQNVEKILK